VEFGAVAELQLLDLFLERALSHGDLWTPEFDYIQRPIRPKAADWHGLQASTNMPGLRAEAITTQGGILMKTTAMLAAALALATYAAEAQEVTLKAVTSFAEKTQFSKNFERFIDKVNADGKGQVQINYIGGPRAMPPFEVGNAVRTKVVDIANVTGAFYTNLMPEADGFKLVSKPQSEQRKDGTFAFINELHNQKLNSFYLARQFHNVPFHIYMNKKIDKLDFTGLKIRVTPVYKDIVEALGGTTVTTAPGEVYTALERGVVDGYGWPVTGIFDLGWEKVTKFRMEPAFYSVEVNVLVNLDTWKSLSDAQRKVLSDAALWLEGLDSENEALIKSERDKQAKTGIQPIEFSAADSKAFLTKANDVGWASVIKRAPDNGAKLRQLSGN
jgi:TRAP-type C4-dicarboxylate transport system substrate-binding protein